MSIGKKVDRTLKTLTGFLIIVGFLVFVSSSMGLLPRGGASYSLIIAKQGIIELIGIVILIILAKQVPYKLWQKYSVHFLVISIILTLLVFIPSIGLSVKGGTRWIDLGIFTFQPAELLKLAAVIFLSAHYARIRNGISDFVEG